MEQPKADIAAVRVCFSPRSGGLLGMPELASPGLEPLRTCSALLSPLPPHHLFDIQTTSNGQLFNMATRIFVHCRSHEMPGPHGEKNRRMANAACQKSWGRDFSAGAGDRLITFGGYFLYNQRCWLIVDNGPVDSTQYEIKAFKWSKAKQDLYAVGCDVIT
jgi:hypothetical protein